MRYIDHTRKVTAAHDAEIERRLYIAEGIIQGNVLPLVPRDTSNLYNSYQGTVACRRGFGNWVLSFGTNVLYAIHVELGTSKMSAIPHLVPGFEASIRAIERIFKK